MIMALMQTYARLSVSLGSITEAVLLFNANFG
jgi:hypothetical protein